MPVTSSDLLPSQRDMSHVWEARRRKALERRAVIAIEEMREAGYTVAVTTPDGRAL